MTTPRIFKVNRRSNHISFGKLGQLLIVCLIFSGPELLP